LKWLKYSHIHGLVVSIMNCFPFPTKYILEDQRFRFFSAIMASNNFLSFVLAYVLCCSHSYADNLKGRIVSDTKRPELLTVTITNPTDRNLSIFALNNVFHTPHTFEPFSIEESHGADRSLPWTQASFDNLERCPDFRHLPPKASFSRRINLYKHIRAASRQPDPFLNLVIRLPKTFDGLLEPNIMGDLKISSPYGERDLPFEVLPVKSEPLHLHLRLERPRGLPRLLKRENPSPGLFLNNNYRRIFAIRLRAAIRQIRLLAQAGLNAVSCPVAGLLDPFEYFFYRQRDEGWVQGGFQSIIGAINKTGITIDLTCVDKGNGCAQNPSWVMYAQPTTWPDPTYYNVNVCQPAQSQTAILPVPCSGAPFAARTLPSILLHEIMHCTSKQTVVDWGYGPSLCRNLKTANNALNPQWDKPITNSDSYHCLAMAAWQFGLGSTTRWSGTGWSGQSCLQSNLLP